MLDPSTCLSIILLQMMKLGAKKGCIPSGVTQLIGTARIESEVQF